MKKLVFHHPCKKKKKKVANYFQIEVFWGKWVMVVVI